MDDAQVIRRTKTNSICGLLFQMWLCFSLALMAYCLCGEVSIVISLFVPLLWTAYLIFRLNWVKSVCKKANLPQLIACALFAPIVFEINFLNVGDKTQYLADIICSPLGSTILRSFIQLIARGFLHLCVLSAIVFLFLNVFVFISPKIKAFYLSLSTREKRFLIIAAFIYIVLVFTFTHLTTLFTFSPVPDAVVYDKIYSLDTGGFLLDDAYTRILHAENDLRNPWFGIMSMPFGVIANLIARLFPHCTYAYTMSILFMQIIVIQISILIIGRLVSASDRNRMQFMLLMEVSFPVLLFSLNAEQYVFPTFWIILLVNAFVKE